VRGALILNPRAASARRSADLQRRLVAQVGPDVAVEAPDGLDGLAAAARALADAGARRIGIVGGDGTAGRTIGALRAAWGARPLPPIALLPGGTMNTVARSLGVRGGLHRAVAGWAEAVQEDRPLPRATRWPLVVRGAAAEQHGFLFGVGVVARFIAAYEASGTPSPAQAAWTLATSVAAGALGRGADGFFAPVRAEVRVDDAPWPDDPVLLAAGAADDLGLGFRALKACVETPGAMGLVATSAAPRGVIADVLRCRVEAALSRHARQGPGHRLVLRLRAPTVFNLDGDLFDAAEEIEVLPGPPVAFEVPPPGAPRAP
jgi:diacylglycerol kinase (ATP)